ncbi:MAG: hypothetical protein HFACDABA_00472 [Anaerolineales bacterium]|nr:hypothetical protein [Anaerolineales bacterium]
METKLKIRKQAFGLSYGLAAGLAFSVALWGLDGYYQARAFAYFPWLKFITGAPLTLLVGGLAGWLTSRFEKPLLGILFWAASAAAYAWLTILVPVVIAPAAMKLFDPALQPLFHYSFHANTSQLTAVAFGWIMIAVFIAAVIQIPMLEQAVFSASVFGRISPHIVCTILLFVSGTLADSLYNQPLREPLISMNNTIQFALDHQGLEVNSKAARQMHLSSLRPVEPYIAAERRLVVSAFDPLLEKVDILINFEGHWVECSTIFNNPLNCASVSP